MYTLYTYSRKRLFASSFQRDQFISVLVKRTLKSIARSTGGRIHTNKWMKLIDSLVASSPSDHGPLLLTQILEQIKKYEKTQKQTCLRIEFLMDYIAARRLTYLDINKLFDRFKPRFEEIGMRDWLIECAHRNDLFIADCGHFESGRNIQYIQGNADTFDFTASSCQSCAQLSSGANERIRDWQNRWILSSFAVECHNGYGTTEMQDRRAHGIQFNVQRQIWHTQSWSPYSNIIDGYHSSKQKGFSIIESPWFKSNRRAFGVELEVQCRSGDKNAAAGRIHEALNPSLNVGEYCFFERDGSIGEGFEIVTQPAGLDVHREKFALFLQDNDMKRGLRSHEGGACGLHVHVGREFLTQSQIYRIQSFLNDVRNEALIRSIARRYENGYCKFKPVMAKFTAHNKQTGDRYEALNVTNPDTIEFRIFRGSLRYESVIAALEFCNALLTFCTPGVTSLIDFTAVGFKKFIIHPNNRVDTKYLRSYLSLDLNNDNERQAA